jgi:hypothetical protein
LGSLSDPKSNHDADLLQCFPLQPMEDPVATSNLIALECDEVVALNERL